MANPTRQAQQQAQHEPPSQSVQPGHEQMPHPLGEPAGREPRFVVPLPPGNNASPITRDPRFGRAPGVYGVSAWGTFALKPGETLGPAVNLVYIPYGVILKNFLFITNGMTGTLQDSLATPTVYGTVSGAVYTMAQMTAPGANNVGTMYASTPRAIGPDGCQVVQWQQGMTLQLFGPGGAQTYPTTTPLIFMVEWAPIYDSGV